MRTPISPPAEPGDVPDDKIQHRFEKFDGEHPEVYALFVQFATELRAAGHTRYSVRALTHRIRWHYAVNALKQDDGFKMNDHFDSRYARKLIMDDPTFATFFETRRLRSSVDGTVAWSERKPRDPVQAAMLDGFYA